MNKLNYPDWTRLDCSTWALFWGQFRICGGAELLNVLLTGQMSWMDGQRLFLFLLIHTVHNQHLVHRLFLLLLLQQRLWRRAHHCQISKTPVRMSQSGDQEDCIRRESIIYSIYMWHMSDSSIRGAFDFLKAWNEASLNYASSKLKQWSRPGIKIWFYDQKVGCAC